MAMVKKLPAKKSSSRRFQTVIASPLIRRCPTSPVVLQGWLSKRGSEGLMLWKKRWCVLSDYCLFYYKDYEEEKLLGSILVPSYKISVCGPEDRVHRKHSFKAEHINMRTYFFAADSTSVMAEWIKALTLASLLQEMPRNDRKSGTNMVSEALLSERNEASSPCADSVASPDQPLYVNAPPKPRRMAEPYVEEMHELPGPMHISLMPQHEHPYGVKPRMNARGPILPVRPRSADLLAGQDCSRSDDVSPVQPRPKSSLSRLTPPQSGLTLEPWSEQGYAEKMRRSAMYVAPKLQQMRTPPAIPSSSAHQYHHQTPRHVYHYVQPPAGHIPKSASARLPCMQEECRHSSPGSSISHDRPDPAQEYTRTQQREESMKRLLEWKQRMLHSPLTQKSDRTGQSEYARLLIDRNQIRMLRDSVQHSQKPAKEDRVISTQRELHDPVNLADRQTIIDVPYRRMKPLNRDIPGDQLCEGKKIGESNWEANSQCTHRTACVKSCVNQTDRTTTPSTSNQPTYYNLRHTVPVNEPMSQNFSQRVTFSSSPSIPDAGDYLKLDETKVLKEFSYHYIKSEEDLSEHKERLVKSGILSVDQPPGALNEVLPIQDISSARNDDKKISSDSERDEEVAAVLCQGVMSVTASSPIQLSPQLEENYMPMTPRKKGSPDTSCQPETLQSVSPTHDESPYVEMTQKEGKTRPKESTSDQLEKLPPLEKNGHELRPCNALESEDALKMGTIEHQSAPSTNAEPLYMEVREKSSDRHTLPDILNTAGSFNHGRQASDSSDADDEASKDLDSSDLRPRFSLSDTFRPASYYLGGSGCEGTLVPVDSDQQDSSDSDLVWPPPIPATSPPLDHLHTSIDSINKSPLPFINLTTGQRSVTPTSDDESVKWRRKTLKRRPLSADILSTLNEFGTEYSKCDTNGHSRVFSETSQQGQQSCDMDGEDVQDVDKLVSKDGSAPYYYSDLLKANQHRSESGRQRQGRWRSLEGLVDGSDETNRVGTASDVWTSPEEGTICWTERQSSADRRTRSLEELDRQPQVDTVLPLLSATQAHVHSVHPPDKGNTKNPEEGNLQNLKIQHEPNHQYPMETKERPHWNIRLSAGELLGRTHEELVLLLIQLRRQRARICKSMEGCHREIEAQQSWLSNVDNTTRVEHLERLEQLKSHLTELERQYEKGKPLVNLVDNMVKLGSLYQGGQGRPVPSSKLEFNHKVEEERLLAEERRDWERIHPDHHDLQAKVEQLYRLDKLLQEESGTLHSLQEDKGLLERALGGLKNKLQTVHGNSAETEWYRRQQRLLERELTRVRSILALNSKKLEETVAENGRLEQELVVLRQKLQVSRRSGVGGTDGLCGGIAMAGGTAALESELWRVQVLVGNLLRQRHELSLQVSQLTEKSNSLSQQMCSSPPSSSPHHYSGDSGNVAKKPVNNMWIETDLDSEKAEVPSSGTVASPRQHTIYISPLYVNTDSQNHQQSYGETGGYPEDFTEESCTLLARSPELYKSYDTEEDVMKRSHGLSWKDRPQEIKTVRIVKRESERRQRDRDRSGNLGIPVACTTPTKKSVTADAPPHGSHSKEKICLDRVMLESAGSINEYTEPPTPPAPRSDSVNTVRNIVRKNKLKGNLLCGASAGGSLPIEKSLDQPSSMDTSAIVTSPQLSPVYLSETARRIVEEVAWQGRRLGTTERRLVPREKRRHHTVSGPSISTQHYVYTQRSSRDDLDMERVLRPRLTTPDVVRSTLHRPDTFTNETIDRLLGAPGKIVIPERYIPEMDDQPPSIEEKARRSRKATAIRKMLTETATITHQDLDEDEEKCIPLKDKVEEEKRNREHLLQLSQILAQEVMEKSKIVAVRAMACLPLKEEPQPQDLDDLSPVTALPLYQQRDNFYS
ncbi:uncharacterized protein isoform X3 [Rhodnius prolixus]|uniref:uncharacterized protein isoform X3 n=1 Tax=Rhodnius prolixus TaxID=13249 RepID=UPI003D18D9CC